MATFLESPPSASSATLETFQLARKPSFSRFIRDARLRRGLTAAVVEVQRDALRRLAIALAPQVDHRVAYPQQRAQVRRILPTRDGRLRGET